MADTQRLGTREKDELRHQLDQWKAAGYEVDRLSSALDGNPDEAQRMFETVGKGIEKLRELSAELSELENANNAEDIRAARKKMFNPWLTHEAENVVVELQVQTERRKKEEFRKNKEEERRLSEVRSRMQALAGQGLSVISLEEALAKGADEAERSLRLFEDGAIRLRDCREELESIDTSSFPHERTLVTEKMRDPLKVHEVEEMLLQLRVKIEKSKRDGLVRNGQEKKERERLVGKLASWKSEGLRISLDENAARTLELGALTRKVAEFETVARRMRELRDELGQINDAELHDDREAVGRILADLDQVHNAEEGIVRLQLRSERLKKDRARRKEEFEKKKVEVQKRITEWKSKGYDTSRIESSLDKDEETIKKEMVMFRIQLRRIQELEAELRALPAGGIEDELARLLAKTHTVSIGVIAELEDGILALKNRLEEQKEAAIKAKEIEKREKQVLVNKLSKWVEDGYRDGLVEKLERVMSRELPVIKEEFTKFEGAIARMDALKREVESIEAPGLAAEKQRILEKIKDISRTDEIEKEIAELRVKADAKAREELAIVEEMKSRRQEFRQKVTEWREHGYSTAGLEKLLDGDMDTLRREMAIVRMRIQKSQELQSELAELPSEDFLKETADIRHNLRDLDRIPENEERIEKLKEVVNARQNHKKKIAEFRERITEWKTQGYETVRLERALSRDLDFINKEFLVFKIRVQKLKEFEEEIRPLERTGLEPEFAAFEGNLRNVDMIGDLREKLSDLQSKIEKRRTDDARRREEEKRLKGEYISRMSAWLEEGYFVDTLEEALGQNPQEMEDAFTRFEEGAKMCTEMRADLDGLHAPGFEEPVQRIKDKLRDITKLETVWADVKDLRERIERKQQEIEQRRKDEEKMRSSLLQQCEIWKKLGYQTNELEKLAPENVEDLRKGVVAFKIRMERMRDLEELLGGLDTAGLEEDFRKVKALSKDLGKIEEVSRNLAALKSKIHARREEGLKKREDLRKMRDGFTDTLMEWLAQGYNVERLEKALDLPFEKMAEEFGRVGARIARLRELQSELDQRGGPEVKALTAKLKDIDAIVQIEEWLGVKEQFSPAKGQQTSSETVNKTETDATPQIARPATSAASGETIKEMAPEKATPKGTGLLDPDKLAFLKTKLAQWRSAGFDTAELDKYIDGGPTDADELRAKLEAFKEKMRRVLEPGNAPPADNSNSPESGKKIKKVKKVTR